ncbi:MAG: maleylpyruvate isomerase family mycothiol-dependent enzyme [Microthrixaceae bacterium]
MATKQLRVQYQEEEVWEWTRADRVVLADFLSQLSAEDLAKKTLCTEWTVSDVAAHLLSMATNSKWELTWKYLVSGLNIERASSRTISETHLRLSDNEIAATLRGTATAQTTPPGLRPLGVLGELVTHIADIELALDQSVNIPVEHFVVGLEYMQYRRKSNTRFTLSRYGRQPVLNCAELTDGLRFEATDIEWSLDDGELVQGPAALLLLAMTGRSEALEQLTGSGVSTLRNRFN